VSEGIHQISAVVQTNSATSEESAAASEELSTQASLMKEMMSKFRLRTDSYMPQTNPETNHVPQNSAEEEDNYVSANMFSKY
jgi:methyl-accepting chemotaxis protein